MTFLDLMQTLDLGPIYAVFLIVLALGIFKLVRGFLPW